MTLLAFGNGAPDVFSALSAVQNMKNNDVGLLLGALLGITIAVAYYTAMSYKMLYYTVLLNYNKRFYFLTFQKIIKQNIVFVINFLYWHTVCYHSSAIDTNYGFSVEFRACSEFFRVCLTLEGHLDEQALIFFGYKWLFNWLYVMCFLCSIDCLHHATFCKSAGFASLQWCMMLSSVCLLVVKIVPAVSVVFGHLYCMQNNQLLAWCRRLSVCLSICLSVMLCIVAKQIHPTAKVSEQVNRKCSLETRFYNFQPPTLILSVEKLHHVMIIRKSCFKTNIHQKQTSVWNWNLASKQTYIKSRLPFETVNKYWRLAISQQQLDFLFYLILTQQQFTLMIVCRCWSVSDNSCSRCCQFMWFVSSHGKTISSWLNLLHRRHLLYILHLL